MNGISGYSAVQENYASSTIKSSNQAKAGSSKKASGTQGRRELSDKAQALLEKLKKTHSNMDFMVEDKGDDKKEVI